MMHGELVSIVTSDNLRLHGFYSRATSTPVIGVDSVVLVHGLGGNFYRSRLLSFFAESFLEQGVSVVLINSRGHDGLNWASLAGRTVSIGAAFEKVADCQHDLHAWTDFLVERGHEKVLWFGHSLGAIKSLFAAAHNPHPQVERIVALSATRLNHEALKASPGGEEFQSMLQLAKQFVDAGQGDQLMKVTFPFPTWMAASAYLEKYGPGNSYDWFQFANQIKQPSLLMFGAKEVAEHPAFSGVKELVETLKSNASNFESCYINGADHFYVGQMATAWSEVKDWLKSKASN